MMNRSMQLALLLLALSSAAAAFGDASNSPRALKKDEVEVEVKVKVAGGPGDKGGPGGKGMVGIDQARMDTVSCPSALLHSIAIETNATLHYEIVPSSPPEADNGIFCARLVVDDHDGWVGFGVSSDGSMAGSDAIIGLPEKEEVEKYNLFGYGAATAPRDKQTLRDTSVYQDDEGAMVMEFTKLLVEEGELPISKSGGNTFLFAKGGTNFGRHEHKLVFTKDFAEDDMSSETPTGSPTGSSTGSPTGSPTREPTNAPQVHQTEMISQNTAPEPTNTPTKQPSAAPTASPSSEPTGAPTASPTGAPTGSPTFTPGTVERYFCTRDEAPLEEKYCNEERFDEWYDDDSCDGKCKGNKECVLKLCVTVQPTGAPTLSSSPSSAPSSSPSIVESSWPSLEPSTASPFSEPTTETPTRDVFDEISSEGDGGFSFSAGDADPTKSVLLSPFQLNLVVAPPSRRLLRGERRLDELFQPAQDVEIVGLVMDHLLAQFERKLDIEPISVTVDISEKSEGMGSDVNTVLVSYGLIGYAVYMDGDDADAPPTTVELDAEVMDAFNTARGRRAFMNALEMSDDDALEDVVFVRASSGTFVGSGMDPNKAIENNNNNLVEDSSTEGGGGAAVAVPIVALIASAFAAAFLIIGFLTYRKYQRYQRNNANNDYRSYQNKKRKIIDKKAKKIKQYNHFESPEGSVVSRSEDPIYNDLEIVGSDADPTSPAKEPTQFNPGAPYDEEAASPTPSAYAYDMTYFANAASQMMDQSRVDDETLEGLYSDKDSYFQSTVGGHHRRGDSIHSLDTLDNTFGFASDADISTLIDGIQEAMENSAEEAKREAGREDLEIPSISTVQRNEMSEDVAASSVNMSVSEGTSDDDSNIFPLLNITKSDAISEDEVDHFLSSVAVSEDEVDHFLKSADQVEGKDGAGVIEGKGVDVPQVEDSAVADTIAENHIGEVTTEDVSLNSQDDTIFEDECASTSEEVTPKNNDDIVKWRFDSTPAASTKDSSGDDQVDAVGFESPDNSEISTTDELYARITELESKILNTETQLARDENLQRATTKPDKSATPEDEAASSIRASAGPSIQNGVFTDETLGMIEQSRLSGTPPPSEGEVDTDLIKEAKENTLLGKFLDDSDSEEEEDCGISIDGVMYG